MNGKKVLVSTVDAWSDNVGSNTMSELFREYGSDNLACLYIRADYSDSASCSRYFHIFEGRVMKSILHPSIATGEEYVTTGLCPTANSDIDEEGRRYSKYRSKKNWLLMFAREFVWVLGHWRSRELDAFLDDFEPDVLVCPIESYIHFNRINRYIIKKKHPKVIGFLWDDNFTYRQFPESVGYRLHRWWLRHSVKRMVSSCTEVVALSTKMKREADAEFGIDCVLLTKPIFNQPAFVDYEVKYPIRMLYTGNLYVNRDRTLATIVKAIREVNGDGPKVILDVYTKSEIPQELISEICVEGCCNVHRAIPQSQVLELQKQADVLLFLEDLKSETGGAARLSFSTKITDYFCAGKCIWAVGSERTSAIEYLKTFDAAICSIDELSVLEDLKRMTSDTGLIGKYAEKGWMCGQERHDSDKILGELYGLLD